MPAMLPCRKHTHCEHQLCRHHIKLPCNPLSTCTRSKRMQCSKKLEKLRAQQLLAAQLDPPLINISGPSTGCQQCCGAAHIAMYAQCCSNWLQPNVSLSLRMRKPPLPCCCCSFTLLSLLPALLPPLALQLEHPPQHSMAGAATQACPSHPAAGFGPPLSRAQPPTPVAVAAPLHGVLNQTWPCWMKWLWRRHCC